MPRGWQWRAAGARHRRIPPSSALTPELRCEGNAGAARSVAAGQDEGSLRSRRSRHRGRRRLASIIELEVEADAVVSLRAGLGVKGDVRRDVGLDAHRALVAADPLLDTEIDAGGDVFAGRERRAAESIRSLRALLAGGQARGARSDVRRQRIQLVAGADAEAVETEAAADRAEHVGTAAARQRRGGLRDLQALQGGDLPQALPEEDARQDLVLRQLGLRGEAQRRRARRAADEDLRRDAARARLRQDVEQRIGLGAAREAEGSARDGEILAEEAVGAVHDLKPAGDERRRAGAADGEAAAPFRIEAVAADEDLPRRVDGESQGDGKAARGVRSLRRRLNLAGAAVDARDGEV